MTEETTFTIDGTTYNINDLSDEGKYYLDILQELQIDLDIKKKELFKAEVCFNSLIKLLGEHVPKEEEFIAE